MADIPYPMTWGTIKGSFGAITADSSDAGLVPDLETVQGSVTITPRIPLVKIYDPEDPMIAIAKVIQCRIIEGKLIGPDGMAEVRVVASDSPGIEPTPLQYDVRMTITGATQQPAPITIDVPTGGVVDLALVVPANPTVPIVTVVSEETKVAAMAAAREAKDAAIDASNSNSAANAARIEAVDAKNSATASSSDAQAARNTAVSSAQDAFASMINSQNAATASIQAQIIAEQARDEAVEAADGATGISSDVVRKYLSDYVYMIAASDHGVVPGGDVTQKLQEIMDTLTAGQTLILPPGRIFLSSPVTVPSGVSVLGAGDATIVEWTGNTSAFSLVAGATDNSFLGIKFRANLVEGATASLAEQSAINSMSSTASSPVRNLDIDNCVFESIHGYGVRIKHLNTFKITNSEFTRYGYAGIAVFCGFNGTVLSNQFTGTNMLPGFAPNSYAGFVSSFTPDGNMGADSNPRSQDITFAFNTVRNQAWEGFDTHIGTRISFIGNNFINCTGNAIAAVGIGSVSRFGCLDIVITDNIITGPGPNIDARAGIILRGQSAGVANAERCTGVISNNIVKWVGDTNSTVSGGILVANGNGVVVSNNTVYEVRSHGIIFQDSQSCVASGNTIRDVWKTSGTPSAFLVSLIVDPTMEVTLSGNQLLRGSLTPGVDIPVGALVNTAGYFATPNNSNITVNQDGNFFPAGTVFSGGVRHVRAGSRGVVEVNGSGPPSTGTWALGDKIINAAPTASTVNSPQYLGWICVTASTTAAPAGVWRPYGQIM